MKKLLLLTLMIFIGWGIACAQARKISGTVTSKDERAPIPGVSVMVKGTLTGTATNIDGKFLLEVPEGKNTLVFSFVGMRTREVPIGPNNSVDVQMETDAVGIDEVIVTALGIKRETKALGYSTQGVQGEELAKTGEVNVVQSLAAKAAGVQVISSAGTPGASSKILIRGNATFTGENQPLIVVDGIPVDNTTSSTYGNDYPYNPNLQGVSDANRAIDIDPEDIESVTILKGPAAAALYGVRAGNGAIVYTTKRGAGGGFKVSYGYKLDVSQVDKLPKRQNKYAQGVNGGGWDFVNNRSTQDNAVLIVADFGPDNIWGTADDVSDGNPYSWGPRMADLNLTPYDNAKEFFETAFSGTHNLSVSGGSEVTTFRLAFGRTDQNGIIPNSSFKRTSVRLTADSKLSKVIKVGGTVNYVNSGGTKVQNGSNVAGIMLTLMRTPVNFRLWDPQYEKGYLFPTGQQRQYFALYDNPYFSAYECPATDEVDRVYGNTYLEYNPLNWLNITYRLGTDVYLDQRKQVLATGSMQATDLSGEIFENMKRNREIYSDLLVSMKHDFTDKINGALTLGQNLNHRNFKDLFGRGRQLGVPGFYNLGNAAELYTDEYSQFIRTAALFFNADLAYNNLLFLGVTGRNEWASTFGPNRNNFFYPSANLSFVFSELLGQSNFFSFGKVRLAYAVAGINAPVYSSRTYYSSPFITDGFTNGFSFPFNGRSGLGYNNVMGNASLSPEKVTGKEVGLDLRFFKGRLTLDVTAYDQKTTDILVQRPIASSSGFRSIQSNSGEMSNKGFEITLGGDPVQTRNFNWNLSANFSLNRSKVLALAEGVNEVEIQAAFTDIGSYAIVGQPYGAFYGTKWERTPDGKLIIGEDGLPLIQLATGGIGNPFPDWLSNIRNTVTYKNLSFTFLFDIRKGGDIWAGTVARLNRQGTSAASADRERTFLIDGVLAQYDEDGNVVYDENGRARYTSQPNTRQIAAIDYWQVYKGDFGTAEEIVTDGSWVRLREVGLNYHVKLNKIFPLVQSADLGFTGRNLWLKTKYPGVDPETSLTGAGKDPESSGGALTGFDYFNNPGSKSYIFSLKVNF